MHVGQVEKLDASEREHETGNGNGSRTEIGSKRGRNQTRTVLVIMSMRSELKDREQFGVQQESSWMFKDERAS